MVTLAGGGLFHLNYCFFRTTQVAAVIVTFLNKNFFGNCKATFGNQTHTRTHPYNGPFPGLPGWAGTRKVKPIWILLKQETVSGSGISWATCKSAPRSRQITTPATHQSVAIKHPKQMQYRPKWCT